MSSILIIIFTLLNTLGAETQPTQTPISVCICVDISGSIVKQDSKSQLLTAYQSIINHLDLSDSAMVVAFGSRPRVVFPAAPIEDWQTKTKILRLIDTFPFEDKYTRYSELAYFLEDAVPSSYRVIILTDAQPAPGCETTEAEIETLNRLKQNHIVIRVFSDKFEIVSTLRDRELPLESDIETPLDSLFLHLRTQLKAEPDASKRGFLLPLLGVLAILIGAAVYFKIRTKTPHQSSLKHEESTTLDADTLDVVVSIKDDESSEIQEQIPLAGKKRISIGSGRKDDVFVEHPEVVPGHVQIYCSEDRITARVYPQKNKRILVLPERIQLSDKVEANVSICSSYEDLKEQLGGGENE